MAKIVNPKHRKMLEFLVKANVYDSEAAALQAVLDKAFRLSDVRGEVVYALFELGWTKREIQEISYLFPGKPDNTLRTINEVAKSVEGLEKKGDKE